jgi:hypothetical protein
MARPLHVHPGDLWPDPACPLYSRSALRDADGRLEIIASPNPLHVGRADVALEWLRQPRGAAITIAPAHGVPFGVGIVELTDPEDRAEDRRRIDAKIIRGLAALGIHCRLTAPGASVRPTIWRRD